MKQFSGISFLIVGVLLALVPRYVLPACEYEGFSRMHCSDTAQAELVTGLFFILIGIVVLFVKSERFAMFAGILSLSLSAWSFVIPDKFGFCQSNRMPCNYGMVPAVRLIAVVGGVVALTLVITTIIRYRRKGKS